MSAARTSRTESVGHVMINRFLVVVAVAAAAVIVVVALSAVDVVVATPALT